MKIGNSIGTLNRTKEVPNDEIYTHIDEISNELIHYKNELRDKIIYCNCDDEKSAFFEYFFGNFNDLGIKKLICTSMNGNGTKLVYDGKTLLREKLKGNGDFASNECVSILNTVDIVITNPPFSLIHKFIDLIISEGKKYLIIGPVTAFQQRHLQQVLEGNFGYGYKDSNKYRMKYQNTDKTYGNHCWLTNLQGDGKKESKFVKKEYDLSTYPMFDDTNILYVDRGDRIPFNYDGVIAISKTFIVGMYNPYDKFLHIETPNGDVKYKIVDFGKNLKINGVNKYDRILIQRIHEKDIIR